MWYILGFECPFCASLDLSAHVVYPQAGVLHMVYPQIRVLVCYFFCVVYIQILSAPCGLSSDLCAPCVSLDPSALCGITLDQSCVFSMLCFLGYKCFMLCILDLSAPCGISSDMSKFFIWSVLGS